MASLSELASVLQTGGAEAYRQTTADYQKYALQQQAYKEAQQENAQMSPPLQGMAKGTLPNGYTLQTPDGGFTASGLLSQQSANAQQDLIASQKLARQARFMEPGSKEQIATIAESRRLQTTATSNMANAKREYQKSIDDALESVYGAKSQQEYDQRIQDALDRTGIPTPKNIPKVWSPDAREKILSAMSPEARNRVEKQERAENREIEESKLRKLRINKLTADEREGGTPAQPTTKVVDGKVVPLSPDDKLETKNYGVAKGKVSTDDKKVARRVNTDAALITSSLDDVMTLNEKGVKELTGSTFSNLPDKGLITAPAKALANTLSDADALTYDSAIGPAIREMVQFMMPDYRPTDAAFVKAEQIYKARAGEPYIVQLQKLAKLRQDYENIGMTYLDAGIMNATQAEQFKANLKKSREMVPWSVKDVANFKVASEKRPNLTFQEFLKEKEIKPVPIPTSDKKDETKKTESKPNVTQEEYNKLKPGELYWWNGKQVPKQ